MTVRYWQKSECPGTDHMKIERQEKLGGERRVEEGR